MPLSDDSQVVSKLGEMFIERRDVRAVQHSNGSYSPERTKFTLQNLRDHVDGKRTYGHYLISPDNRSRIFAFDLDVIRHPVTWEHESEGRVEFDPREAFLDKNHWARPLLISQMNTLALVLAQRIQKLYGFRVAASYSGNKGVHVYAFTGSRPAELVRDAALGVLRSFGDRFEPIRGNSVFGVLGYAVEIEVFPKQSSLDGKDLGNLMRLPLGVNQKTGQESFFLRLQQSSPTFNQLEPHTVLVDGQSPC